jgi:enterochelin esterase-like enzyme
MKHFIIAFFLTSLSISSALAQPGGQTANAVLLPEVANDGRVTFRLKALMASSVIVSGDFGPNVAMKKGDNNIWSVTVGPLEPEEYAYYFILDSVRILDPSNPRVKIGYVTSTTTNLLNVPTKDPAFYDVQDVPHGEIRTLVYKSKSNGIVRELTVYVPPGYDEAPNKRYPVLYLLHGFANDQHSWHRYGRANDILDNLLAKKTIEPFIVVMPLGYGGAHINGDGTGIAASNAGRIGGDADLYQRDILEDIIPMIEKKYRTIADRNHRAIFGFSMGGGQAGRYGLSNLDKFSYIGIMSAGLGGGGSSTEPLKTLATDPKKANEQIKLLWIACGRQDFAFNGAKATSDALKQIGIKHSFVETEGEHHWRVWRRFLRDVSPLLFK